MGGAANTIGGGKPMLTLTSTPAIAGIGTAITDAKSNVNKINFLILMPPLHITALSPISLFAYHYRYYDIAHARTAINDRLQRKVL